MDDCARQEMESDGYEYHGPTLEDSPGYDTPKLEDDSTDDPCFHCKNLGMDTVDNCAGCSDH